MKLRLIVVQNMIVPQEIFFSSPNTLTGKTWNQNLKKIWRNISKKLDNNSYFNLNQTSLI